MERSLVSHLTGGLPPLPTASEDPRPESETLESASQVFNARLLTLFQQLPDTPLPRLFSKIATTLSNHYLGQPFALALLHADDHLTLLDNHEGSRILSRTLGVKAPLHYHTDGSIELRRLVMFPIAQWGRLQLLLSTEKRALKPDSLKHIARQLAPLTELAWRSYQLRLEQQSKPVLVVDRAGYPIFSNKRGEQTTEWPLQQGRLSSQVLAQLLEGHGWQNSKVRLQAATFGTLLEVTATPRDVSELLTRREQEIAGGFAKGGCYKSVAAQFNISPRTVRNHLYRVYTKLGVHDKAALAQRLLQH